MIHIIAFLMFAGYLMAALVTMVVMRRTHVGSIRRRAASLFIAYTVLATFSAGLAQKNAWPFSDWPLIAGVVPADVSEVRIVGLDAEGNEHAIDPRVWEPLSHRELLSYMDRVLRRLQPEAQERVAAHLLAVAEHSRQRAADGKSFGKARRWLGPARAPYFVLQAHPWDVLDSIPRTPFVAIRAYVYWWNVDERRSGISRGAKDMIYDPGVGGGRE